MSFNPYAPHAKPSGENVDAPLYAAVDGLAEALGEDECAFLPVGSAVAQVMTLQVLEALDHCRPFRTLDEHVDAIQQAIPALRGQQRAVATVLAHLLDRGLLRSDADLLGDLRLAARPRRAVNRQVIIRTCDRPAQLQALLDSATDSALAAAGSHWWVLDDSRDPDRAATQRRAAEAFARARGLQLRHCDGAQRQQLAERLAAAIPEHRAAIIDLLGGPGADPAFTGGRGFNLGLLLAAGEHCVLLDDDQTLELRERPGAAPGIDIGPPGALPASFFADAESLRAATRRVDDARLLTALDWTGAGLGALIDLPELTLSRQQLRGRTLAELPLLKPALRVVALTQGAWGSARTASNTWMFTLDAASRRSFWGPDEAAYRHNLQGRMLLHGCDRARLLATGNFTPLAIDLTDFAPFAAPTGRGEDAVFAALTRFCVPDGAVLELPFALGHGQEAGRLRQGVGGELELPSVNHFIRDFLGQRSEDYRAADPLQRLQLAAALLRDLAESAPQRLAEALSEYALVFRAVRIRRLQQAFAEAASEAPPWWRADLNALVERHGKALTGNHLRFEGWPENGAASDYAGHLKSALLRMSAACAAWARLWPFVLENPGQLARWLD